MIPEYTPSTALSRGAQLMRSLRRSVQVYALALVMVVVGAGLQVFTAHATSGHYMKLVTSDGGSTFYVGRCFRTNIKVQTDNLNANSVDVIIPYNPTYLTPYTDSGCTTVATAIRTVPLFPSYPTNTIASNTITVTGYDPSGTAPVNTGAAPADSMLGYTYWKVLSTSGSFLLKFDFTLGSTTDTNMAQAGGNGTDVLDGVENLTLNLSGDTVGPTFSSLVPVSGATSVSVTTPITYTVNDAGAGTNSGSLTATLNGVSKPVTVSSCTKTNSNRYPSCNASISPGTLLYATSYTVVANANDLMATPNVGSQSWSFTTEDDTDAPYVQTLVPAANATGVSPYTTVSMHIKDYKGNLGVTPGLGVDSSTISVTLTAGTGAPITYTSSSPQMAISGIAADRTVVITPNAPFGQNQLIAVAVHASDLHSPPNVMSTYSYSFRTTDSVPPVITPASPASGATGMAADSNVVVLLADSGAGIDLNNTTITVAGTAYTRTSPQFSYTGNSGALLVTIDPTSNFTGGQAVTVSVSTRDLASTPNTASKTYGFSVASACATCSVSNESPARFTRSAALTNIVTFHVKDTGAGIDGNTIRIVLIGTGAAMPVNPLTLTGASSMVAISGTAADKTVTVTLVGALQDNVPYAITIDANDVNGLSMSKVGYTFMHLTTTTTVNTTTTSTTCDTSTSGTSTDNGGSGGARRPVPPMVEAIPSLSLPSIVARHRLPNGTYANRPLSPDEARTVSTCYIDDIAHKAAPLTPFQDVPAGAWYEQALKRFLDRGVIDATSTLFNPTASAQRVEIAKLLVLLSGHSNAAVPHTPSFDDTKSSDWYYAFSEQSAARGWLKGYNNCYGTHPCMLNPAADASRAEALALIVRYHSLQPLHLAPTFTDVKADAWYASAIQTAADYCIVQGDAKKSALPAQSMTRAEMVQFLDRADHNLRYGKDCGVAKPVSGLKGSLLSSDGGSVGATFVSFLSLLCLPVFLLLRRPRRVPGKNEPFSA